MADFSLSAKQQDRLQGLIPGKAAGRASITTGVVATTVAKTIAVTDPNVDKYTNIVATIVESPDSAWGLASAVAGDRVITFTIVNRSGGNSTDGTLTIAYLGF